MDILRESASQGALQRAVLSEQGLITERGYAEQAQSFSNMAAAEGQAAAAEKFAGFGSEVTAGIKIAAGIGQLAVPGL
jgi:hypothetical protein